MACEDISEETSEQSKKDKNSLPDRCHHSHGTPPGQLDHHPSVLTCGLFDTRQPVNGPASAASTEPVSWRRDYYWWGTRQACECRSSPKISPVDTKREVRTMYEKAHIRPGCYVAATVITEWRFLLWYSPEYILTHRSSQSISKCASYPTGLL